MIVKFIPSPVENAQMKIEQIYSGPRKGDKLVPNQIVTSMLECDPNGPLMIHTVKNYSTQDATSFHILGRVFSGTITENQPVKILGENYSIYDEEDSRVLTAGKLWIHESR
jgi:116 kDa U5 small nuclear ribonucleoprotein component